MTAEPVPHPTDITEPATTLRYVRQLQVHTRHDLGSYWFPLVVFGLLTLASVPFALPEGGAAIAIFWALAGPAGGAIIGWYYHSREHRLGVSRSGAPFVVTGVALIVAAFLLPAVTTGALQEVVSAFAVGGAYLVFAWLNRSSLLALLGGVVAAIPAGALASGMARPGPLVATTTGVVILLAGLVARRREVRSS